MSRSGRLAALVALVVVLSVVTSGVALSGSVNSTDGPTALTPTAEVSGVVDTPVPTAVDTPVEGAPTATPEPTPTATQTATPEPTPTPTATPTPAPTPTATLTPTPTPTPSAGESNPAPVKVTSGVAELVDRSSLRPAGTQPERITVRVNARPGRGDSAAALARGNGGAVEARSGDRMVVELPAPAVTALADSSAVGSIELPERPQTTASSVTSEGIYNVTADEVQAQGYDGSGVTIAVVDLEGSFNADNPEFADNIVGVKDVTNGQTFTNGSGAGGHGSAVAEIVVDTAPQASLELIEVQTGIEIENAIQHARQDTEADVIVMSLGIYVGPFDGSGPIGDDLADARSDGIPTFISAGNAGGGKHLNLTWNDPDADDELNFAGSDERLGITLENYASSVSVDVSWDDYPASNEDYDVYLYDDSGQQIDSSTTAQTGILDPEESVSTSAANCPCDLEIRRVNANGTADFDIFATDGTTFEYSTSTRSLTRPATDEDAVAVGAVYWDGKYLESFSSRGPTIDGREKPAFVAPDGVSSSVYGDAPSGFFGTSAAAPHAAGVAALLMEAEPSATPSALEQALEGTARQTDGTYSPPDPNTDTGHGLIDAAAALDQLQGGSLLTEQWRYDTGRRAQYASPAATADRVFVGGLGDTLYALDRSAGTVDWQFSRAGSLSDSSPLVDGGTVYVGSGSGTVYALDTATGSEQWSHATDSAVVSSPATDGSTVYVGSNDGTVLALDTSNGAQQWTYEAGDAVFSTPAVANGRVFLTTDDGRVVALDSATGNELWTVDTGTELGHASPTVDSGTVYVAADNLYALDADNNGQQQWSVSLPGGPGSTPTVDGTTVFVGRGDGTVTARSTADGSIVWNTDGGGAVETKPAVASGTVVVSSTDGGVTALDTSTGAATKTVTPGGAVRSSPTIRNGVVYVGTDGGVVVALTPLSN